LEAAAAEAVSAGLAEAALVAAAPGEAGRVCFKAPFL